MKDHDPQGFIPLERCAMRIVEQGIGKQQQYHSLKEQISIRLSNSIIINRFYRTLIFVITGKKNCFEIFDPTQVYIFLPSIPNGYLIYNWFYSYCYSRSVNITLASLSMRIVLGI